MYFRRLIRDTFNCINIIDEKVENTLTTKDRKSQSNLLEIKKDESNRFSNNTLTTKTMIFFFRNRYAIYKYRFI